MSYLQLPHCQATIRPVQHVTMFVCLFKLWAGVSSLTESPCRLIHYETDLGSWGLQGPAKRAGWVESPQSLFVLATCTVPNQFFKTAETTIIFMIFKIKNFTEKLVWHCTFSPHIVTNLFQSSIPCSTALHNLWTLYSVYLSHEPWAKILHDYSLGGNDQVYNQNIDPAALQFSMQHWRIS